MDTSVSKKIMYQELLEEYSGCIEGLIRQTYEQVSRQEFASGGNSLHRGYYCPSPVQDIIIGNCKRGKLLKKNQKNSKLSYKYCYDREDRLILVFQYAHELKNKLASIELLIYLEKYVLSILYSPSYEGIKGEIKGITKCEYKEGFITNYEFAVISQGVRCNEIRVEKYKYENKLLMECLCENYLFVTRTGLEIAKNVSDLDLEAFSVFLNNFSIEEYKKEEVQNVEIEREKYTFLHDQEGFLTGYTVKEYEGENEKESYWDGHIFEIDKLKRRKV